MVWLREGENILKIHLFASTESRNVTDGQTDTQTPHESAKAALAQHRGKKYEQLCSVIVRSLRTRKHPRGSHLRKA